MLFMCCSFLSLRRSVGFEESQQIAGWFFFECDGAIGFFLHFPIIYTWSFPPPLYV